MNETDSVQLIFQFSLVSNVKSLFTFAIKKNFTFWKEKGEEREKGGKKGEEAIKNDFRRN